MRVRVHLSGLRNAIIPVDYHYILSSWVYGTIRRGDEDIATELHYMKDVKPLTLSEIYAPGRVEGENIRMINDNGSFVFSSHRRDIVEAFVEGALMEPEIQLKNRRMMISSIEVLREPEFKRRMRFKTLSPIVVSVSRAEAKEDKRRFLYPTDQRWYVNLEKNIRRRFRKFAGEEYSGILRIRGIRHISSKRYNIKGTYVRASKVIFEIQGDERVIRMAYQSGFGERTAQGFGCVDVWKEKKELPHKPVLV